MSVISTILAIKQGVVKIYEPQKTLILSNIDNGDHPLEITAKQLAFLGNATITASSLQIVCDGTFANLAVLDAEHVEVIADEIYLGGSTTTENQENVVLVSNQEEIYLGDDLAREAVGKIVREARKKLGHAAQPCHFTANKRARR
jgi:hypothetical protein